MCDHLSFATTIKNTKIFLWRLRFVRTDWPAHSHCNENFDFNQK